MAAEAGSARAAVPRRAGAGLNAPEGANRRSAHLLVFYGEKAAEKRHQPGGL